MSSKAFKARYVFPGDGAPIEGGAVHVRGNRIVEVGRHVSASAIEDMGDVAILPGLINVHCHLEFSQLQRPIGEPRPLFADWIRQVIQWRLTAVQSDSQPYWQEAIRIGLRESLAAGVTCVGDIVTADDAVECYAEYPGQAVLFRELLGLAVDRAAGLRTIARNHVGQTPPAQGQPLRALSPHAPYSTRLDVVHDACQLSCQHRFPVAMHVAESQEELELLNSGSGPLFQLLAELGAWDQAALPVPTTCAQYIDCLSHAHQALVIHGNYLTPSEWDQLAQNSIRMVAVYCPRTHHYFGHQAYQLAEMIKAGVKVAIATDGRSSNPDLNLLDDLRAAARWHSDVDPAVILRAGTLTAAEALGCAQDRGSLQPGKRADLVTVPLNHSTYRDPWSALFGSDDPVQRVYVGGTEMSKGMNG
jgi:cytosine/adenosine deaminase-related metal-dependent hydrolase